MFINPSQFADFYLIKNFLLNRYGNLQFIESHQVFMVKDSTDGPVVLLPKYSSNSDDLSPDVIATKIQLAFSYKEQIKAKLLFIKIFGDVVCLSNNQRDFYFQIKNEKH